MSHSLDASRLFADRRMTLQTKRVHRPIAAVAERSGVTLKKPQDCFTCPFGTR